MKVLICLQLTFIFFVGGCMVGPDYQRPTTAADTKDPYVYKDKDWPKEGDANNLNRWWEHFGDDITTQLVEQALKENLDLEVAAARVLQAEAFLKQASGSRLPFIDYELNRGRAKNSFNFGNGGRFSNISTTFRQEFTVSYILDVFGKLKRGERAAWGDLLAAESNRVAVTQAIISSVVKSRAQIATIQRQLNIARSNTKNWERNLVIVERRYGQGLVSPLDVRLARENLEASKSNEVPIEFALIRARNALDVLVNRRPATGGELARTLPEIPKLDPVPTGLPAQLLERRPDIKAAEFALQAASERIGVNVAEMYPDFTLVGSIGRSADRWRDIWKGETEIYSLIFHMTQPIFRGGQLKARVEGAEARFAELAAVYGKTVLTALQEVEDAMVNEELLQKLLVIVERRFAEASAAEKLANSRYARGVEKLVTVLEAERRRRISENELNLAKGQLWAGRVDLILALGGDWGVEEVAFETEKEKIYE